MVSGSSPRPATASRRNPLTGQTLYYNGGSSIWDPSGNKVAQAPVVPPEVLSPGAHGMIMADITPSMAEPVAQGGAGATQTGNVWPSCAASCAYGFERNRLHPKTSWSKPCRGRSSGKPPAVLPQPPRGGLLVLPELFSIGPDAGSAAYTAAAEPARRRSGAALVRGRKGWRRLRRRQLS